MLDEHGPTAPVIVRAAVLFETALFLPHPTQARADINRIARRHFFLCWHCGDWPRASLKIAEDVIWDKSRARGVHVPVAITLL